MWIDLTNSPHVLVMRPVIEVLRGDGHEVSVTARDFAQTLELLDRFGIEHTAIGRHRGEHRGAKAVGLFSRGATLMRWAVRHGPVAPGTGRPMIARRPFDLALGHGSNDITVVAAALRIPCTTMFDYEFAALQHQINCRLANVVVVPEAIPPERLFRYGARGKIAAYEGLKEEYYLADFEPNRAVLDELSLTVDRPIVVVRTPPELALYHRFDNDLFGELLARLSGRALAGAVQVVVLARTAAQRERISSLDGLLVPAHAIDAQSLVAHASLVISAGGTMNREAVALGTPVLTTFQGRLGAVDERLMSEGRLGALTDLGQLDGVLGRLRLPGPGHGVPPPTKASRTRRDPRVIVDLLLSARHR